MTVTAQTSSNSSTGNGVTTVFPYTFKIIDDGDIEVRVDGVLQTLSTHYTVSGVGDNAGGNVTMLTAPANGAIVARRRNMALVRATDYQYQGNLPAAVLNPDQDAPVLMVQQMQEQISRSARGPAGETWAELPAAADRLDLFPVFDATTGALELSTVTQTQVASAVAAAYAAGSTADAVTFLPAGTGATARTVQAKLRESVSVLDFGAVGDGVTDDTVAIQAAIDSLTSGGIVYFPPGDYYTSAIITVAVEATSLVGAGTVSTRIKANHTAGAVFRFTRSYCGVKSMMVWGTATRVASTDATGFGVHFECDDAVDSSTNRTRYILVEHCRIVQQPSSGVAIVGPVTNGSVIRQCYIQSNRGHGIVIDRGDLTSRSNMGGAGPVAVSIADCEIHGNGGNAIAAGSPTDTATTPTARITLDNLDIASNATNVSTRYGTHQVWLRGTNISVRDCGIASDGTAAGILIAGRNHFITNNRFIECTASVEIEDFTALSGLSTQGVTIEGLSVITAVALAQNPAVILNSGVTATSIKNWLPSNITSIVTAGYQVELQQTSQMVVKTTDTVINNTDVLADDPDLKFWVAANESVKFRVSLQHISANTGSDLKVAITCPSGSIRYGVPGGIKIDTAETVAVQNDVSASGTALTFGSTTSRRNIVIEGYFQNSSTAGYLTVQWAQAVATAANTTVYTYSNLTIWREV